MTWRRGLRSLPWVVALLILFGSGLIQGRLDGRWATSPDLAAAVSRLDRLPRELGTWTGTDGDPDLATLHRIGLAGGVLRRYHDSRTGNVVTALLVCGRPGPVSVHTPDVCYAGAGYAMSAPPTEAIPGFLAAKMVRSSAAGTDRLQVYWSWNGGSQWEAPANPRLTFGARPYLYKLYVVRTTTDTEALGNGPGAEFAEMLRRVMSTMRAATPQTG